jgi:hypothetical protein
MELEFSERYFDKYSNVKFYENQYEPNSIMRKGIRTDGQMERKKDGQTDITKLIIAFHKVSNARNNHSEESAFENPLKLNLSHTHKRERKVTLLHKNETLT